MYELTAVTGPGVGPAVLSVHQEVEAALAAADRVGARFTAQLAATDSNVGRPFPLRLAVVQQNSGRIVAYCSYLGS